MENVIDSNTMKEWNELFPPNDEEKRKNDIIYDIQGNFNRYVEDSTLVFEIGSN